MEDHIIMSSAKSIALDWIEDNRDLIVDLSDRIWEFAELPMREFKSSRLIAARARIESMEGVQTQDVRPPRRYQVIS